MSLKIQFITIVKSEKRFIGDDIIVSSFHDFRSLDDYDINVISFQDESIWRNNDNNLCGLNCQNDLNSINISIYNSKKTKILFLLPQNYFFNYYFRNNSFNHKCEIKNCLFETHKLLSTIINGIEYDRFYYEKTNSIIDNTQYESDFVFSTTINSLQTSTSSKCVVKKLNNKYITTLNIDNLEKLLKLLNYLDLLEAKESVPDWMNNYKYFNDFELNEVVNDQKLIIKKAKEKIEKAENLIDRNNEFKSILYESGKRLEKTISTIFENIFDIDLKDFKDEKKEDLHFERNGYYFLVEIKGINTNVKRNNVVQIDSHREDYLDINPNAEEEKTKGLLIINHQRQKDPDEREKINESQIDLAKKYGVLIIETKTLLDIFSDYYLQRITKEQCFELLINNTGLLQYHPRGGSV